MRPRTQKNLAVTLAASVAISTLIGGVAQADEGRGGRWAARDDGRYDGRYDGRGARPGAGEYARVVDVDPIRRQVRVVQPVQQCYEQTRYEQAPAYDSSYDDYGDRRGGARRNGEQAAGAMILGGLIGAALGNQIGHGDGRRAATVAGALIGTAIGHDTAHRDDRYGSVRTGYYAPPEARTVTRCETRMTEQWEERIDGYRVTYEYNGRRFETRLPYDPGRTLRVRVDVRPDEG
jgi:uncharacterized protein YcfJ